MKRKLLLTSLLAGLLLAQTQIDPRTQIRASGTVSRVLGYVPGTGVVFIDIGPGLALTGPVGGSFVLSATATGATVSGLQRDQFISTGTSVAAFTTSAAVKGDVQVARGGLVQDEGVAPGGYTKTVNGSGTVTVVLSRPLISTADGPDILVLTYLK